MSVSKDIANLEKYQEVIYQKMIDVIANQKKIKHLIDKHKLEIEQWNKKIILAQQLGDESLVNSAFIQKNKLQNHILELNQQLELDQQEQKKLRGKYDQLKSQINLLKIKKRHHASQQKIEQEQSPKQTNFSKSGHQNNRKSDKIFNAKKWRQKASQVKFRYLASIVLIILTLYAIFSNKNEGGRIVGIVNRVIDGDTIIVKNMRVRLLNVDTEESVHPTRRNTEFGRITSAHVRQELTGKEVQLECHGQDVYGRSLCYVFIKSWLGQKLYNVELVQDGWSKYYTKYGISQNYHSEFTRAEKQAKNNEIGVWEK